MLTSQLIVHPGTVQAARNNAIVGVSVAERQESLSEALWRHSTETPTKLAVWSEEIPTTYGELWQRVCQMVSDCARAGVVYGDVIAFSGRRSELPIVTLVAAEMLGAVYLPLETTWPLARLCDVLLGSGAAFLIVDDANASRAAIEAAGQNLITVVELSASSAHREVPPRFVDADEIRYVIYTSGTTGSPKGALVEHGGMMNHLYSKIDAMTLTSADVFAFSAPLGFDISIWQMTVALVIGAATVVVSEHELAFPSLLRSHLTRTGCTVAEFVPTVAGWLADNESRQPQATPFPLRWIISTGEELKPVTASRISKSFPSARLLNAYGPTECSDDIAHYEFRPEDADRPRLPVGTPIRNTTFYVLIEIDGQPDGPSFRAALPGEPGELFVGGRCVGRGYMNDPERSTQVFFSDEFDPGSPTRRLYRTGDRVRLEDGLVIYLGRIDRQVKVSGVRLEPGEIEAVLSRHPTVESCAVVVRGCKRAELAVFVVITGDVEMEQLRNFVSQSLPPALVPRTWTRLAELPLTPNGKIDFRRLEQSEWETIND